MKYANIKSDPHIMGGQACLSGTRIPMDLILTIVMKKGVDGFLKEYPGYSKEHVEAAVDEVARNINRWVDQDLNNYQCSHWFVSVIQTGVVNEEESVVATRNFGFFPTYDMANESVLDNDADIHEGSFNWAVVEEVYWGTMALSVGEYAEQWYCWNDVYKRFHQTTKPKWAKGIVGWSIG